MSMELGSTALGMRGVLTATNYEMYYKISANDGLLADKTSYSTASHTGVEAASAGIELIEVFT